MRASHILANLDEMYVLCGVECSNERGVEASKLVDSISAMRKLRFDDKNICAKFNQSVWASKAHSMRVEKLDPRSRLKGVSELLA